jgi:hypothetical protein
MIVTGTFGRLVAVMDDVAGFGIVRIVFEGVHDMSRLVSADSRFWLDYESPWSSILFHSQVGLFMRTSFSRVHDFYWTDIKILIHRY